MSASAAAAPAASPNPARVLATGAHPVRVTGARVLVAVALHAAVFALVAWAIDPLISETGDWGLPGADVTAQHALLWSQTAIPPALVWGALVLVRAAGRRRVEGTYFAMSAIVVAIVAFAAAVPLIVLQVPVQGPGIAMAAWLLAGCAGSVVVGASIARERRVSRSGAGS